MRGKISQYSSSLNHAHLMSKSFEAGHEARERERVDRELRDRLVGARVGLVVEDVHAAVSHLQEIDVAGDGARLVAIARGRARCRAVVRARRCRASSSQIGISIATVTLSLASMKCCSVS